MTTDYFDPRQAIKWAERRYKDFPASSLRLALASETGDQAVHDNPVGEFGFNADDDCYPSELDWALRAWRAVSKSEGKGKPKDRILNWLHQNTKLSDAAKERISVVANWDKRGGATRTSLS